MLICWSSIAAPKGRFLEDENGKYITKNDILESLESAVIFYYIKKDKSLENLVRKYLLNNPKLDEISKEIKKRVFEKYPILEDIEIPEKIYLPKENISKESVKVLDLETKEFVKTFKAEVFKGVIENFEIKSKNLEKIKTAAKSYARALLEYEHKALKESEFEDLIAEYQNSVANEWEIPIRIGEWTSDSYKAHLLFFYRIKDVREYLIKNLNIDISLKDVLYLPKTNEFLGWSEIK